MADKAGEDITESDKKLKPFKIGVLAADVMGVDAALVDGLENELRVLALGLAC